jgi:hypothetical protein
VPAAAALGCLILLAMLVPGCCTFVASSGDLFRSEAGRWCAAPSSGTSGQQSAEGSPNQESLFILACGQCTAVALATTVPLIPTCCDYRSLWACTTCWNGTQHTTRQVVSNVCCATCDTFRCAEIAHSQLGISHIVWLFDAGLLARLLWGKQSSSVVVGYIDVLASSSS